MCRSTLYNVDNLKTGDIILFSGNCFVSRIVQICSNSKWSHMGMIFIDPYYPYPLIYESSHGTDLTCLDIGEKTAGPQMLPFNERRRTFAGDMALRRLNCSLSAEDSYLLHSFRKAMEGKPFERSNLQMLASLLSSRFLPSREDLSSVFCSELIAHCYQEIGLLDREPPSNKYAPVDFSTDRNLRLTRGKLGPQISIKEYRT